MPTTLGQLKPVLPACRGSCNAGFGGRFRERRQTKSRRLKHTVVTRAQIGLLYSSSTGNTHAVAHLIKKRLGNAVTSPREASSLSGMADLCQHASDGLVIGAPTWATACTDFRTGTAMDDLLWQVRMAADEDLKGKKFAVFGCGDAKQWPDNFVDAMDELYTTLVSAGATPVGHWKPKAGEEYLPINHSKAFREDGGHFVGLPIDNISQKHLTIPRVSRWCEQLEHEFGLSGAPCGPTSSVDGFDVHDAEPYQALQDMDSYPCHWKPTWIHTSNGYTLFGSRLMGSWYQFSGDSGAAGRWLKFTDEHILMRAGLRGQPEYQIEYGAVVSVDMVPSENSGSPLSLVLKLSDSGRAKSNRAWSRCVVLRGVDRDEARGLCDFLRERGANFIMNAL